MNPNREVYDPEPEGEPVTRPNLHALEGGGQTSEPTRGHLHPVENNPETSGSEPATKSRLRGLEGGVRTSGAALGGGLMGRLKPASFTPAGVLKGMFKGKNRRAAIGGGLGLGILGLIIGAFLMLIPLKIEDMQSNIQNRFYAELNKAVAKETDNAFEDFIKREIGPALARGACKGYVSKDCRLNYSATSNNPVKNLYNTWAQAKIENTLADDYGIELRYDPGSRTYFMKAPGINGEEKVGTAASGIDGEFDQVTRGQIRQELRNAEEGMTWFQKLMFRYPVGMTLTEKYGLKRCLSFCDTQDALSDKKDAVLRGLTERQSAAEIYLVQRILVPYDAARGIAMACMLDTNCDPTKTQPTAPEDGTTEALHGAPENPEVDTQIRNSMVQLAGTASSSTIDDALSEYKKMQDDGFTKYMIDAVLEKVGLSDLSKQVNSMVPVIGWFEKFATVVNWMKNAGPLVQKLSYVTLAPAAVQVFNMYNSYSQEIHTGNANITELGSMTDSLSPGNHGAPNDPEVGGTAGAEQTPLYGAVMGDSSSSSPGAVSLINSLLPAKAYAASKSSWGGSSSYLCSNGKSPSALICPEERLGAGSGTLNSIHNFLSQGFIGDITGGMNVINSSVFKVASTVFSSALGFLLSHIPGISSVISGIGGLIGQVMQPFMTQLMNNVLPNPFGSNMSGGRIGDEDIIGGAVSGSDAAHYTIGGERISDSQAKSDYAYMQDQAQQQFSKQPLFARLFSTDSQFSLISKVAMDMPFGEQASFENGFSTLLTNPLVVLGNNFASIFSGKTSASASPDIYGAINVTPYGYPDSAIPAHPSDTWDQQCSDGVDGATTQKWDQYAASNNDSNTEMPANDSTDPCLLIQAMASSAGGKFDSTNLTADDKTVFSGASGSSSTPTSTAPGQYQNPLRDVKQIWFRRIDQGVDYGGQGPVYALGNGTVDEVYHYGENSGWPLSLSDSTDGGWVSYTLTDGPAAGQVVYVAESCNPTVTKNQQVNTNTVICQMNGMSYPWIETGWANGTAGTQALAAKYGGNGSTSTYSGLNFAQLMNSLGAPNATPDTMNGGPLPANFPKWN